MKPIYTNPLIPRARAMRREQTPAERKLWYEFLRRHATKFRRQVPLCGYILDFYAHAPALCIELDGESHDSPDAQAYDAERTRVLNAAGITVIRFSNREVMQHFEGVCAVIEAAVKDTPQSAGADSSPKREP